MDEPGEVFHIPSNGKKRPQDVGLYPPASAILDREKIATDKGVIDYIKVWKIDGENAASFIADNGSTVVDDTGSATTVGTTVDAITGDRPKRVARIEIPDMYVKGQAFRWEGHAPDGENDDEYTYQWTHNFGSKIANVTPLDRRIVTGVVVEDVAVDDFSVSVGCDINPA